MSAELTEGFDPISLEELDERAALRRRVDTKYVIPRDRLAGLADRMRDRYLVLEIDGRREFDYESVYFDTADLRCFRDHVDDVRPRFKTRTRLYRETAACFVEVKVKDAEDETTKRQCDLDPADHGRLTETAWAFLDESLRELAGQPTPDDLEPSLSTRYRRITLAAREQAERVTLDLHVELSAMDNRAVRLDDGLVLVETKGEGEAGDSQVRHGFTRRAPKPAGLG